MKLNDIYQFWFIDNTAAQWWQKSIDFDSEIQHKFSAVLAQAIAGELVNWREQARGALCEILILDQFSRNIYRDTPKAFSQDPQALVLAQNAIQCGFDKELNDDEKTFLYLPFMHSESRLIHKKAVHLFEDLDSFDFELAHKKIIDRFGRYPHRNEILNRQSTAEEIAFLKQPNSSF